MGSSRSVGVRWVAVLAGPLAAAAAVVAGGPGPGRIAGAECAAPTQAASLRVVFGDRGEAVVRRVGGARLPADGATADVRWPEHAPSARIRRSRAALERVSRRLYGPVATWRVARTDGGPLGPVATKVARAAIRRGDPGAVVTTASTACLPGPGRAVGPAGRQPVPAGQPAGGSPTSPGSTVTGAGAPPPGGATPSRARFGVAVGSTLAYLPDAELRRRLDEVAAAGAGRIRVDVSWATAQLGGPNSFDWKPFDAIVAAARARGLQVLATLVHTPAWAVRAGDGGGPGARPADPAALGRFAGAAAKHFAPLGVHDYEVWNEPNLAGFWRDPDPADYTAFLVAAHAAIAGADPQARVVTGGLGPASDGPGTRAPIGFLKGIYAAGGRGAFEAVGHHPYTSPARPSGTHPLNAWFQMSGTAESLRSVMRDHGDAAKPIWATEFGAATGGGEQRSVSEAEQAAQLREAYALAGSAAWAGPVFWYELRDRGADSTAESFFGLVRTDGTRKPAFTAYQDAAKAG